jgi:hypothetical protein
LTANASYDKIEQSSQHNGSWETNKNVVKRGGQIDVQGGIQPKRSVLPYERQRSTWVSQSRTCKNEEGIFKKSAQVV